MLREWVSNELEWIWKGTVVIYSSYYPDNCLKGLRETEKKNSTLTADVPTNIRTEHLHNSSPEQYRYASLLSNLTFCVPLSQRRLCRHSNGDIPTPSVWWVTARSWIIQVSPTCMPNLNWDRPAYSALVGWERRSLKYFPLCLFL
jgi:hypothetical protein